MKRLCVLLGTSGLFVMPPGLLGMRERVRQLEGRLRIDSVVLNVPSEGA